MLLNVHSLSSRTFMHDHNGTAAAGSAGTSYIHRYGARYTKMHGCTRLEVGSDRLPMSRNHGNKESSGIGANDAMEPNVPVRLKVVFGAKVGGHTWMLG